MAFVTFYDILEHRKPGLVIELGVYRGVTFEAICRAVRPQEAYGFDWFYGLPEPWERDPAGTFSTGGKLPRVEGNGRLVIGRIENTLHEFLDEKDDFVSFVHFDMDLYGPTKYALEIVTHWCQPGTVFAFDEIDGEQRNLDHEQRAFREWQETAPFTAARIGGLHSASWVVRLA